MVLEGYRERVRPQVERMSSPFLRWPPSRISAIALVLAALAGVLCGERPLARPLGLSPVALLVFVSGFFDVIDGAVARLTHQASARGDFLDHVFDRYADIFIVGRARRFSFANPVLALLALVSLLLTSYMGTQAQAVGAGRLAGLLISSRPPRDPCPRDVPRVRLDPPMALGSFHAVGALRTGGIFLHGHRRGLPLLHHRRSVDGGRPGRFVPPVVPRPASPERLGRPGVFLPPPHLSTGNTAAGGAISHRST